MYKRHKLISYETWFYKLLQAKETLESLRFKSKVSLKQRQHPIIAQMLCRLRSNRSIGCISLKQSIFFYPYFFFLPSQQIYTETCLELQLGAFKFAPGNN